MTIEISNLSLAASENTELRLGRPLCFEQLIHGPMFHELIDVVVAYVLAFSGNGACRPVIASHHISRYDRYKLDNDPQTPKYFFLDPSTSFRQRPSSLPLSVRCTTVVSFYFRSRSLLDVYFEITIPGGIGNCLLSGIFVSKSLLLL